MSQLLAQSLAVAAMVWGHPACGQPQIVWASPVQATMALGIAITETPYTPPAGWPGDLSSCTIVLNRTAFTLRGTQPGWARELRREEICTALVHEWGHLAGQGHSADPQNVMYGDGVSSPYWRCLPRWRARQAAP
jgi:hypothetical protein